MKFKNLAKILLLGLLSITMSSNGINVEYPGCTDPIALNYDPDATVDNGTCVYSIGPDLVIIDIDITNHYCNAVDIEVYTYTATVVNIGTEDIDYFCLSDFLGGSAYNCFNGAVNPNVYVAALDTVQVNGNLSIPGGWYNGQMNYMSVLSVPGEIITGNNNFVFSMQGDLDCSMGGGGGNDEGCDTVYVDVPIYITDTIIEYVPEYIYQTDTLYVTEYITEYITEYVTDTIYEFITDTIYLTDTLYITETITDTIYLTETEYITDTLYITEYLTDTLYVDNYIFLTDTVTEYIVQEIWIDCETGLPCDEEPPGLECPDWTTLHIPNTFTPNNDGFNDVWKIVYDLNCWENVEFKIYNRWGEEIYHAYGDFFDSYPYWDGSVNNGNYYVSDGVYLYLVKGKKVGRSEVIQKTGHITVLR